MSFAPSALCPPPHHALAPGLDLQAAVRLEVGSLDVDAALRGAVRALAQAGRTVEIPAAAVYDQGDAEAFTAACWELATLGVLSEGRLRVVGAPGPQSPDPWIAAAQEAAVVVSDALATDTLTRLHAAWAARTGALTGPDRLRGEFLTRAVDDGARRAAFRVLRRAWLSDRADLPGEPLDKVRTVQVCESVLGEPVRWKKGFRRYTYDGERRMVVIPTWQCELRCAYCYIPKQDGRVMPVDTLERSVELLMSTERDRVVLQFFGGEALLEYDRVRHAITYALERGAALGKEVGFILSSNGWSLTRDKLDWLAARGVRLELSLDGDARTQTRFRPARWKGEDSYEHSIAACADDILASGIEQYVIMVVHPTNVDALAHNFFHIADLGFRHIQINNMLGRVWKPHEQQVWAQQLHAIGQELLRRWRAGERLEFINMRHKPMAMRLNGEVTVDWDGTIYGGNAFLHETDHKEKFVVGHLDDLTGVDRYWVDATDNNFLLDWSYRRKVTENNVEVGKVMASLCAWLTRQGFAPDGAPRPVPRDGERAAAR